MHGVQRLDGVAEGDNGGECVRRVRVAGGGEVDGGQGGEEGCDGGSVGRKAAGVVGVVGMVGGMHAEATVAVNPSTYRSHQVALGFSKRTRPRAERAGGQPLRRLTSVFLHLKALEPPYNRPREALLKIRRARTPRL